MKKLILVGMTFGLMLSFLTAAKGGSPTRKWGYPLADENTYFAEGQIVPDGSGGVAVSLRPMTTAPYLIIWVDQNGQEVYRKTDVQPFYIVAASDHLLAFNHPNDPTLTFVTDKGKESVAQASSDSFFHTDPQFFKANENSDHSGFFVIEIPFHGGNFNIVRYSVN